MQRRDSRRSSVNGGSLFSDYNQGPVTADPKNFLEAVSKHSLEAASKHSLEVVSKHSLEAVSKHWILFALGTNVIFLFIFFYHYTEWNTPRFFLNYLTQLDSILPLT